jgi:amino acid transporter
LVAATYFIVSGGPYGLEELIAKAGYRAALWILLLTPLVWSLPTALLVGELSSAIPAEGGYYVWVRRALGPFWGFQEAWLSLAASLFDMAIYPTLFVLYLGQIAPTFGKGLPALGVELLMIALCALWNLSGARAIGRGSLWLGLLLLAPFALLTGVAFAKGVQPPHLTASSSLLVGVLVAMWNYMGWDNASTFAGEVDRPQRTYPLAMGITVLLVTLSYLLPTLAVQQVGLDASGWTTGSWVGAATAVVGPWLGTAVVVGGVVSAFGMFNSLVLSYSRLPAALATDGYLPEIFGKPLAKNGAPWFSVLACAIAYASCLGLGFDRLVQLDIVLYGLSLVLEFAALAMLRVREPALSRPFRIPGGLSGVIALGVPPTLLLGAALWMSFADPDSSPGGMKLAASLVAAGPVLFFLLKGRAARQAQANAAVSEA